MSISIDPQIYITKEEYRKYIAQEFPDKVSEASAIAGKLGIPVKKAIGTLEEKAEEGWAVFRLKGRTGHYAYFVHESSLLNTIAYLKQGRIFEQWEEDPPEPKEHNLKKETYGRMESLLTQFLPIRDELRKRELSIGLNCEQLTDVISYMKRKRYARLSTKKSYTSKELKKELKIWEGLQEKKRDLAGKIIDENAPFIERTIRSRAKEGFLDDLRQVAKMGMARALEKYDSSFSNRFLTYASHWIRSYVTRFMHDCSRTVRMPVHYIEKGMQIKRVALKARSLENRELTEEDLRMEMGNVPNDWKEIYIKFTNYRTVSLDAPVYDESNSKFSDLFEQKCFANQEEGLTTLELAQRVLEGADLDEREKEIIDLHFGFEDELTLEGIGERFNLSRERIRQIKEEAIDKMRSYARLNGIL